MSSNGVLRASNDSLPRTLAERRWGIAVTGITLALGAGAAWVVIAIATPDLPGVVGRLIQTTAILTVVAIVTPTLPGFGPYRIKRASRILKQIGIAALYSAAIYGAVIGTFIWFSAPDYRYAAGWMLLIGSPCMGYVLICGALELQSWWRQRRQSVGQSPSGE